MSNVPYSHMLGDHEPAEVIAATPLRIATIYDRLTPEQVEDRPAPGKWNLREVMCHIADCEIAWAWRLRLAFEKERAEMQPFDQDPWAQMYVRYTLAEARATFNALRSWNIAFIGGLSEVDRHKPIHHPEMGEKTLWTLVEIMAGHDLHHLKTLDAL